MGFQLVPLSSGDLKIQSHTFFQWAVFQTISKVDTWLILDSVKRAKTILHFKVYLESVKFELYTDHAAAALKWLLTTVVRCITQRHLWGAKY